MMQNQEKYSIRELADEIWKTRVSIEGIGFTSPSMAYLAMSLYRKHPVPTVILTSTPREAEKVTMDFEFFFSALGVPVAHFPPYAPLADKGVVYHNETAATRVRVLYRILNDKAPILVLSMEAALQKVIPKNDLTAFAELLMENEELDRDLLIRKLISGGYVRTAVVEEPGDFSVRGGILDLFSPIYPDPLRIELSGDTIVSLRFFSAVSQRKLNSLSEAVILPAREVVIPEKNLERILTRIRTLGSELDLPVTTIRNLISRIKQQDIPVEMEGMLPLIYENPETIFDYLPDEAWIVMMEPGSLEKATIEFNDGLIRNFITAEREKRFCIKPETHSLDWKNLEELLRTRRRFFSGMLPVSRFDGKEGGKWRCWSPDIEEEEGLTRELLTRKETDLLFEPLAEWIRRQQNLERTVVLVCGTRSQANRVEGLLEPYGVRLRIMDEFNLESIFRAASPIQTYICLGRLSRGFVWGTEQLAILTEDEIFGEKRRRKVHRRRLLQSIRIAFEDLQKGDLVVHDDHGIGRYEGLVKLKVEGMTNDFLTIRYKDEDKLYLPVDRMEMIRKYLGVEGIEPVLDKLGGRSWEKVKERVKKTAEKIAGELLSLYAERKVMKGHAFKPVDRYFQDFEAAFPYEETEDQLRVIHEIFEDMEKPTPMDRLVCGDVGYGKTEVALRAAYMAVNDGKQVAVLVPTTVLAEQHYETFSKRFERYPVTVACLSRFRSDKEQRTILESLSAGRTDIVIGTHRLLQKDVEFKDLGLLIVDEEQRFGVKHKEKLKKLRRTIDVLVLTATPIPRTLHLSLTGVRDVSLISTPPEQRHPIITYVSELDDRIIADAVRRELKRNGQVFFVHNNIHGIWKMAKHLKDLIPEARIGVAHGRLNETELEDVMISFFRKEIDLLVCTAIIESGLDVPSANTILINRADRFGLAQIYQLRGRVGRSTEQAFAYLFIPRESALTPDARKRLKVLMEYSDLGSGFQIAMRDLEIRGGGTILGASQSGHIAAVGYDMFLKLMETAVSELKGEPADEELQPEINIEMSAFIPEFYVADIDQRLSIYRRLSRMTELKEISELKSELVDRFGQMPIEAINLFVKIMLKILAVKAGVRRMDLTPENLILHFSPHHLGDSADLIKMIRSNPGRFSLSPGHQLKIKLAKNNQKGLLVEARNILKAISEHVNKNKFSAIYQRQKSTPSIDRASRR
jgi:transcription-repair coupling factor (superfamily II helicase)